MFAQDVFTIRDVGIIVQYCMSGYIWDIPGKSSTAADVNSVPTRRFYQETLHITFTLSKTLSYIVSYVLL